MEIILGKTAGFCFGVENAVTRTEKEVQKNKEIYCLGELVHNRQVTEDLIAKGVKFIEEIDPEKKKVIIRAHGVKKEIYEKAKKLNISLIDLTCPKVLKIHKIVEEYSNKGYYICLIGQKSHPETIGTKSFCGNFYSNIEKNDEIMDLVKNVKKSNLDKMLIISQTTFNLDKYNEIVENVKNKLPSNIYLEEKNTICDTTRLRQEETKKISKQVELMIVVGSKNSSNSTKLYEIAKENCKNVIFIENDKGIKKEDIKSYNKVGIMAGASTSIKSINLIIEKLKLL